jgi:uncharacterized protein YeaC (DUF1315 family)
MSTAMNPEVKQKWIDALRSGKYEQGSEKLRTVSGYCCLGVLCDLYAQEHNTEWEFRGIEETNLQPKDYWYFEDQSEFVPESVMDWAGFTENCPVVKIDVEEDDEDSWFYHEGLADLNDSGYTFNELSKLIQEQL